MKNNNSLFVCGIGTGVGKTVASAILAELYQADYWKPVQAGDLENGDKHKVEKWISNDVSRIFLSIWGIIFVSDFRLFENRLLARRFYSLDFLCTRFGWRICIKKRGTSISRVGVSNGKIDG